MNVKHWQWLRSPEKPADKSLMKVVETLVLSDLELAGRAILKFVRLTWRNHPVQTGKVPKAHPQNPTGPFSVTRRRQRGDLLIFVPRGWNSLLIDDLTGKYGYSHVAIDCGEVDLPTGKAVMIESMVGQLVGRRFLDEYGQRHFARIPLAKTGIQPDDFCACAESKIGEPYDNLEAITWGMVDDPAKQVCSDLAAVCLPETVREDIAAASRSGLIHRRSVSVHGPLHAEHGVREFISPNGFAAYFGAPQGKDLHKADQRIIPRRATDPPQSGPLDLLRQEGWKILLFFAVLAALWAWTQKFTRPR